VRITRRVFTFAAALAISQCFALAWFGYQTALASTSQTGADGGPTCDQDDLQCWQRRGTPPRSGAPRDGRDSSSTPKPCADAEGLSIPCTSQWGTWSRTYGCYLRLDPDQPPPPQPGRKGQYYICHTPTAGTPNFDLWLDGGAPAPVDPGQVAREILARIQLQRVGIGITPEPGRTGVLGLPTYLWVNNAGPHTLGPISDSATEGGVTVTLTARVSNVVWNLGDGTTITCAGAGTPYRDEFGARPSRTCGHTYKHPSTELPGGVYRVTATAVWDVAWTGGGQSGQIPFEVGSSTTIRIGEVQALT
jgi:hypothetical protein